MLKTIPLKELNSPSEVRVALDANLSFLCQMHTRARARSEEGVIFGLVTLQNIKWMILALPQLHPATTYYVCIFKIDDGRPRKQHVCFQREVANHTYILIRHHVYPESDAYSPPCPTRESRRWCTSANGLPVAHPYNKICWSRQIIFPAGCDLRVQTK